MKYTGWFIPLGDGQIILSKRLRTKPRSLIWNSSYYWKWANCLVRAECSITLYENEMRQQSFRIIRKYLWHAGSIEEKYPESSISPVWTYRIEYERAHPYISTWSVDIGLGELMGKVASDLRPALKLEKRSEATRTRKQNQSSVYEPRSLQNWRRDLRFDFRLPTTLVVNLRIHGIHVDLRSKSEMVYKAAIPFISL
jgi:hypothetical protein